MTERDQIIHSLSDPELLIYHQLGGRVSPLQIPRLERQLAGVAAEGFVSTATQPREAYSPGLARDRRSGRKVRAVA